MCCPSVAEKLAEGVSADMTVKYMIYKGYLSTTFFYPRFYPHNESGLDRTTVDDSDCFSCDSRGERLGSRDGGIEVVRRQLTWPVDDN
jgi:hypothetical protein